MKTIKYNVEGMSCGGCGDKITNALKGSVVSTNISLEDKEVLVECSDELSNMSIKSSIEDLGFTVIGMKKVL